MSTPKDVLATFYFWYLKRIRVIAREMGYAITLHGSIVRDLDLIAVPWVDDVAPPHELAEAIRAWLEGECNKDDPAEKPHGRLVWTISLPFGGFIDLGIISPTTQPQQDDE